MFSKLARSVVRHAVPRRNMAASFDGYGQHLFKGAVAVPYLEKAGLPANTLDTPAWTSNGNADKVLIKDNLHNLWYKHLQYDNSFT